jgi:hypothetical protein
MEDSIQADASASASSEKVIEAAEQRLHAAAVENARQIVENNVAFGDVDDDTAIVMTGGMIGDVLALVQALRSIAGNTCCDGCREAALVARSALDQVGLNFSDEALALASA